MWIIPRNSRFSAFVPDTAVLLMCMEASMFSFRQHAEILQCVVRLVLVYVVNIATFWNGTICLLPDDAVQKISLPIRASVVPVDSPCIFMPVVHYERQRLSGTHLIATSGKALVDGLATYAKGRANLRKAESLSIEFIHTLSRLDIWFTTHGRIFSERMTGVNR